MAALDPTLHPTDRVKHANTTKNTTTSVEAIVVIKSKSKTALFLILCQYGQTEKPEGALVFYFITLACLLCYLVICLHKVKCL